MMTMTPRDPVALERRVAELEGENIQLTERVLGAEQRLARAAQLYAAVAELHKTADTDEVVTVIKEIVANLLGCEEMGVYDVFPLGPVCTLVDGIGLEANRFGTLPPTHSLVRNAISTRRVLVPADPMAEPLNGLPVSAVVPLVDADKVCGLVILFSMLRQKPVVEATDLDLLEALGAHAGRALIHARLREQAR
jgi:GAF domain-containing protein